MPQGLQVFKADGSLRVTLADRLTRITGQQSAASAGSASVDTTKGTPWGVILTDGAQAYAPVTISGGTISWPAYTTGSVVLYGVY